MRIEFTKVTWYSWVTAIVVFVATFWIGFALGQMYEAASIAARPQPATLTPLPAAPAASSTTDGSVPPPPPGGSPTASGAVINDVTFSCPSGQSIHAVFYASRTVVLDLSDGRHMTLPQTISASGARYANSDESFVFWNKGNGAFIQENGTTTYNNCTLSSPAK